jgi:ribonuclease VapC
VKYLFDTKALIAFFNEEGGADFVQELLAKVDEGKVEGLISSITLTEIHYVYSGAVGKDTAKKRVEQVQMSKLRIVSIDAEVAVKAGEYRTHAIPIADALIAGCTWFTNARIVTDDEHFGKLGLEIVRFR